MAIAGLFLLFFAAMLLAWLGRRDQALILFGISFVLAIAVFLYHASGVLNVEL
jgi:hypothetical protein